MHTIPELQTQERTITGKKVKLLREGGLVPAELFGKNVQNKHLSVKESDFVKLRKTGGEHGMIHLIFGNEKIPVLITDLQRHPITQKIINIDFRHVDIHQKIHAKVPLEFTGESPAVKAGHVLVKVAHEIEIEALPQNIPHAITVDISKLEEIGHSIYVKDLEIPRDVKILAHSENSIVSVTEQKKEEEPAPAPVATPTEGEAAPTEQEGEVVKQQTPATKQTETK